MCVFHNHCAHFQKMQSNLQFQKGIRVCWYGEESVRVSCREGLTRACENVPYLDCGDCATEHMSKYLVVCFK